MEPAALECVENILGRDVTSRSRRVRATAETGYTAVDGTYAHVDGSYGVRDAHAKGIMELLSH